MEFEATRKRDTGATQLIGISLTGTVGTHVYGKLASMCAFYSMCLVSI